MEISRLDLRNQCILPCVVDLLPKNSSLVHCIRAYIHYRILVGLHCMTDERIKKLENAILVYQKCCAVSLRISIFFLVSVITTHSM